MVPQSPAPIRKMRNFRDASMMAVPMTPLSTVKIDLSMPSPSPISVATGVSWEEPPQTPMNQRLSEMMSFGQQRRYSHGGLSTPRSFASMSTLSESPMSFVDEDFSFSPYNPTPNQGKYHWHATAGVEARDTAPKRPKQPRRASVGGSVMSASPLSSLTPSPKEIADRMNRQRPLLIRRASMGSLYHDDDHDDDDDKNKQDRFATGCEDSKPLGSAPRSNASVQSRSCARNFSSNTGQSHDGSTNAAVRQNAKPPRRGLSRRASMSNLKQTRSLERQESETRWKEGPARLQDNRPKMMRRASLGTSDVAWSYNAKKEDNHDSLRIHKPGPSKSSQKAAPERCLPRKTSSSALRLVESQNAIRRSRLARCASMSSLLDDSAKPRRNKSKKDKPELDEVEPEVDPSSATKHEEKPKKPRPGLTRRASMSALQGHKKTSSKPKKERSIDTSMDHHALSSSSSSIYAAATPSRPSRPALTRRASMSNLTRDSSTTTSRRLNKESSVANHPVISTDSLDFRSQHAKSIKKKRIDV